MIYTSTAKIIKSSRDRLDATLQEVASWVKMSSSQVNALERGYHKFPLKKMNLFCEKLLIQPEQLEEAIVEDHRRYLRAYRRTYEKF
jgi:hypothetical protein